MGKVCSKCKQDKPLEEFAKWSQGKDGKNCYCRVCIRELRKLRNNKLAEKELLPTLSSKVCHECKQEKVIEEFYRISDRRNGSSYCKDCCSKLRKSHEYKERDKIHVC